MCASVRVCRLMRSRRFVFILNLQHLFGIFTVSIRCVRLCVYVQSNINVYMVPFMHEWM